jgi:type II secretory pathway pseudopilin PulG
MTLLEVMIAMAILATSGVALAAYGVQTGSAVARARAAEVEMRRGSAFFDAVALWPREDLDRRLGEHNEGIWRLLIERPTPTLYSVTLEDSSARHVILHTELFRRVPRSDQQRGESP